MNTSVLHADVDGFQVAIIVLAVIFSFLKWLWEQWTGNKQAAEIEERAAQARETRRRLENAPATPADRAWQSKPPPVPPVIATSPWEEVRKAWREVREASQAPKPVQQAAPSPLRRQPQTPPPPPPMPAAKPVAAPAIAASPVVSSTTAQPVMLQSLRSLRQDRAALRRAFVMSEVLGPPKALALD